MRHLGAYVRHNARRFPNKPAIVTDRQRMSYAELDRTSDRLAGALVGLGVRPGDRVALLAEASAPWVAAFFGIVKTGAVAVPCNYRETPAVVGGILRDAGCRIVFASRAKLEMLAGLDLDRTVLLDDDGPDGVDALSDRGGEVPPVEPRSDDPAIILYTGGTTGASKGVVLSHANLFWNCINEIIDTRMDETDNTLLATPLHHSAALNTWLLPHLYLGATATILGDFDPDRWLDAVERHGITNSFTPPTLIRQILDAGERRGMTLSGFRRWYSGAGLLPRQDRERMKALCPGVGIYYEYGLTEAGPIVTVLKDEDYETAPNSIGRAVLNAEVRILRADRSVAEPGETGEIAVRGPAVMAGYFNRPDATAAAFHDGWLLTGDMAAMNAGGYLEFHDRLKDMIKTGGMNVFSQEVEHALAAHPAVREVAVIGVPDPAWGERVTAVVTLHDGQSATEPELIGHCRSRLAGYQTPKRILFMAYDAVPRNYLGKILKRDLRRQIAG